MKLLMSKNYDSPLLWNLKWTWHQRVYCRLISLNWGKTERKSFETAIVDKHKRSRTMKTFSENAVKDWYKGERDFNWHSNIKVINTYNMNTCGYRRFTLNPSYLLKVKELLTKIIHSSWTYKIYNSQLFNAFFFRSICVLLTKRR